jgi:hypothetical protein
LTAVVFRFDGFVLRLRTGFDGVVPVVVVEEADGWRRTPPPAILVAPDPETARFFAADCPYRVFEFDVSARCADRSC